MKTNQINTQILQTYTNNPQGFSEYAQNKLTTEEFQNLSEILPSLVLPTYEQAKTSVVTSNNLDIKLNLSEDTLGELKKDNSEFSTVLMGKEWCREHSSDWCPHNSLIASMLDAALRTSEYMSGEER